MIKVVAQWWRNMWRNTLDVLIGPVDNPLLRKNIWNRLQARSCRKHGHQDHVPAHGGYPGMPQSHCYYCGKENSSSTANKPWDLPIA